MFDFILCTIYFVFVLCVYNTLVYFLYKRKAFKLYYIPVLFPAIRIAVAMSFFSYLVILGFRYGFIPDEQSKWFILGAVIAYYVGRLSYFNTIYYREYNDIYYASKKRKNVSYS